MVYRISLTPSRRNELELVVRDFGYIFFNFMVLKLILILYPFVQIQIINYYTINIPHIVEDF